MVAVSSAAFQSTMPGKRQTESGGHIFERWAFPKPRRSPSCKICEVRTPARNLQDTVHMPLCHLQRELHPGAERRRLRPYYWRTQSGHVGRTGGRYTRAIQKQGNEYFFESTYVFIWNVFYQSHGFFIECGANDGEFLSNTLWFEKVLGWNGLLIEADPDTFTRLRVKNRKASHANVCLSPTTYPSKVIWKAWTNPYEKTHNWKEP